MFVLEVIAGTIVGIVCFVGLVCFVFSILL